MLTEWGRKALKPIFEFIASIFEKLHITPNAITVLAFVLSLIVAYLIIIDQLLWAGILYFLGAGLDAIDGTLARRVGVRSNFGAFLDSTLDRFGESTVTGALIVWAALRGDMLGVFFAFTALVTSFMVSYTRARAEGLGYEAKVGFGSRVERFFIMVIALLFKQPIIGLALITLLAGITTIQRIYVVWKQAKAVMTED
ncbi:MAG TPA: CDP-alcohol phosphatidyltransferase family protein [Caldilineae bacterium]|nr:CDP-alcohol phosphatidyltransferase family protein [Caldilineae bacterium]